MTGRFSNTGQPIYLPKEHDVSEHIDIIFLYEQSSIFLIRASVENEFLILHSLIINSGQVLDNIQQLCSGLQISSTNIILM